MTYDKAYFIAKFSALNESDIGTGHIKNHCALWHCGVVEINGAYVPNPESLALARMLGDYEGETGIIYQINDGIDSRYLQPTPKARILAALNDLP